ncbi:hypothetical protein [Marinibactrum halimedae]|uniref:hypothetical protein n=1 Tax=Marinibactrum halimedae TaxID=1444977 RepID=UPI001E3BDCD7|nr:hypothetical protein [Marinibactrum halimedae]MCD9458187.1 hypothetical protein [Marinibactrum halimedae]
MLTLSDVFHDACSVVAGRADKSTNREAKNAFRAYWKQAMSDYLNLSATENTQNSTPLTLDGAQLFNHLRSACIDTLNVSLESIIHDAFVHWESTQATSVVSPGATVTAVNGFEVEERSVQPLTTHTIEGVYRPVVKVAWKQNELTQCQFDVEFELNLSSCLLAWHKGCLHSVSIGGCLFSGQIKLWGTTILHQPVIPIDVVHDVAFRN